MRAPIKSHVDAAIVAIDHVAWIGGVNPNVMVVHVDIVLCNGRPIRSAVRAFKQRDAPDDESVGIGRVHRNEAEIVAVAVANLV